MGTVSALWDRREVAAVSEGFCPEHLVPMTLYPPDRQGFGDEDINDWQGHDGHGYSLTLMLRHVAPDVTYAELLP